MTKGRPLKNAILYLLLYFSFRRESPAALMVRERRGLFRMYQYSTPSRAAMPRV